MKLLLYSKVIYFDSTKGSLSCFIYNIVAKQAMWSIINMQNNTESIQEVSNERALYLAEAPADPDAVLEVRDAIGGLPEGYRDVMLCVLAGESQEESTTRLGISRAAYRWRKNRAEEMLRVALA